MAYYEPLSPGEYPAFMRGLVAQGIPCMGYRYSNFDQHGYGVIRTKHYDPEPIYKYDKEAALMVVKGYRKPEAVPKTAVKRFLRVIEQLNRANYDVETFYYEGGQPYDRHCS